MRFKCKIQRRQHRQQWGDWSLAISWLINWMPMRSEEFQPLEPDQINPYKSEAVSRGVPLKRGDPEAKAALQAAAERAAARPK